MSSKAALFARTMPKPPPLFAHQKQSRTRLKKSELIFDTSDPGTGKTRPEVEDFTDRRAKGGGCMLVLATKSLLTSAWEEDFRKFAPDMRVSVAFAANREKAFESNADVYVTNHDAVKWLAAKPASFFKKFDTICVDESPAFKHATSQRSKAAAKIIKHFRYRRLLTGTPNGNGICDIWHQVFLLDGGARLGKSFFAFRNAACIPEQSGPMPNMIKWVDRPGIESTVATMIRDITIRHKFEDCVDIPENHKYAVPFRLGKKHMAAYQDMADFQILQLKKEKTTVTAVNGAVVASKLLQIASGATYNDDGAYSLIDSERYDLVLDLVEARKHSIVFFTWTHQRDELIKEATKRGLAHAVYDGGTQDKQRTQIVKDYQAGEYRVLFAHPQSAGHGLTLTKGTATIWASPTYNLEHFLQGLKRVHRIGQTEKTETIVVVAQGTIDEVVWQALQDKSVKMVDLLENLM
jgi:SNF2 family DNA or RNA helicase